MKLKEFSCILHLLILFLWHRPVCMWWVHSHPGTFWMNYSSGIHFLTRRWFNIPNFNHKFTVFLRNTIKFHLSSWKSDWLYLHFNSTWKVKYHRFWECIYKFLRVKFDFQILLPSVQMQVVSSSRSLYSH